MQKESYALAQQFSKILGQMATWIDKVEADSKARKYDADALLTCRLAPDMFPLMRQYASANDNGKLFAQRLSGKKAPPQSDDQTTWAQVRERLSATIGYLDGLTEADFAKASEATATFPWMPGKGLEAGHYMEAFATPNFYFHVGMAYAILRENGVPLGKADFLGMIDFKDV